jgi:hypothetical protein
MNYVISLYSKKCDRFEIESLTDIEDIRELAHSLVPITNHYNNKNNIQDFEIISIVKMGE